MARIKCFGMRIISGTFGGRRLTPPKDIKARPTTDMAREALFNILGGMYDFEGKKILDLFAGTGAVSLEFISRGAQSVTAIDIEMISKKFIGNTIRDWEIDNMRIVRADVFKLAQKANESFDIVFADPPYGSKRFALVPQMIFDSGWLAEDGLVIVEHGDEHSFDDHPYFEKHKRYGSVNFSFFHKSTT